MKERLLFHIPCPVSPVLFLAEKSCHVHLSSLAYQNGAQRTDSLLTAIDCLGTAFQARDLDSLYTCKVGLTRGARATEFVRLISANSQLHGLNRETDSFQFGYEPEIAAVIDLFVSNHGTLVDVGANFGYFSIWVASRSGFSGTAYAIEPSYRGFSDLQTLVSGFSLGDRIQMYQCALGDCSGAAELFFSNSDGLTTIMSSMAGRSEKVVNTQTVEVRRLDDFLLPGVDLIKIDVEGAEAMVISGGRQTISTHLPVVVFESWRSVDDSGAFTTLMESGYKFFAPAWINTRGEMCNAPKEAVKPADLVLANFTSTERSILPERINVIAVPQIRLAILADYRVPPIAPKLATS